MGSCGTEERRWPFEQCPGYWLRHPPEWEDCPSIDGQRTAFETAWQAHWEYDRGHSLGDPAPPKLMEAVVLFESETRARVALGYQKMDEQRKRDELRAKYPKAGVVASG